MIIVILLLENVDHAIKPVKIVLDPILGSVLNVGKISRNFSIKIMNV